MSTSRLVAALGLLGVLLPAASVPEPAWVPASRNAPAPEVSCYACLVVDDRGVELWGRRPGRSFPNASTTKLVTALVAVEELSLEQQVRVSGAAASVPGGILSLEAGESFTVDALLHGLLMASSNDAAVALAEAAAGSEEAFVALMNEKAASLGTEGTTFGNAHGLDVPGHASSPRDLVIVAEEVLGHPVLADIVATSDTTITGSDRTVAIENTNVLLETYEGAIGVKTGFTALAGNVLVAAAEHRGRRLIAVAMHSEDAFVDAASLLDFGFARLRRTILLPRREPVGAVVFGTGESVTAVVEEPLRGIEDPDSLVAEFAPADRLRLPVEEGDRLGTVTLTSHGRSVAVADVVASASVAHNSSSWPESALSDLLRTAAALINEGGS